ncbi:hypothetical protein BUALT_Bualt02G0198100 [Buddleja alternifolia]|uniref:Uncharacterized protein n=1 Tax=Buddleja alternifolia TaxID=168488 RepID=A0AAV6Y2V4_9LAMI|nr:hypothetical protein BUALT_Bualt02G0198100 [Buddleja alternifolia]
MENQGPMILEISSDEEAGFGDTRSGGGDDILGEIDYDFLSKLLGDINGNKGDDCCDDSDDVVFVSEVLPKQPKKPRVEPLNPSAKVVGNECGEDDDCVVLDGDPDKQAVVVRNGRVDHDDDNDSDDLEIIGEKGETSECIMLAVAELDLCANITSKLYGCQVAATYRVTQTSESVLRTTACGSILLQIVACRDFPHARHLCAKFVFASTSHEVHCSQCHCYVCDSLAPCSHWGTGASSVDHCHASDKEEHWRSERKSKQKGDKPTRVQVIRNNRKSSTAILEAFLQSTQHPPICPPGLRPATTHHFSVSSNVSVPSLINRSRSHQNVQSFAPRAVLKRPAMIEGSPNNRRARGSQFSRNPPPKRYDMFQMNGSNQHNIGRRAAAHSVPSRPRPQIHSQPKSSCLIREPIHSQSQTPSRPFISGSVVNSLPFQTQVVASHSQPSVENFNNVILPHQPVGVLLQPSQTLGPSYHSRSISYSNPNVGNNNNLDNQSYQPQAYGYPTTSLLNSDQNDFQHARNCIDASWADFGQNNSQYQSDIMKDNHNQSIAHVDNIYQQSVEPADIFSVINDKDSQFPGTTNPDSWIFENHFSPGAPEVPVSPGWDDLFL